MRRSLRLVGLALLLTATACASWSGARLYVSGTEALDRGEPARAVTDLEAAARLLPESSEVQNHLGIAYDAVGRPDAARAAWERAVSLDCSNEAAAKNLRSARAGAPDPGGVGAAP